jgi:uncharacterized protein DUF4349
MLSMARIGGPGSAILATVLISLAIVACGSAGTAAGPVASGGSYLGAPAATAAPALPGDDTTAGQAGDGSGANDGNGDGTAGQVVHQLNQPGLLIIKTGTLALQVEAIDPAVADASLKVTALGGYVAGSERSGDGDADRASITFRIPAERWDDALVQLRRIATKIVNEHTSSQDVTGQVVDLGARIRNLQATERAVQAIMDRATAIDDVLTVQAELTRIRGEIEQLATQKAGLEGQAAFSTLTVMFSREPEPEPTATPTLVPTEHYDAGTEVSAASASLVGLLQTLATAGIWFGIVWLPILLTIGLFVAIGVAIYRRAMRTPHDPGTPAMPAPTAEA